MLHFDETVLEEHQSWNTAYAIFHGNILILFDVELDQVQAALILVSDLIEDRRDRLARSAPLSPEVYQYWYLRVENFIVPGVLGNFEGFPLFLPPE